MSEIMLTADAVLTMDAENRIIAPGAVLVRNDRIVAVGPPLDVALRAPLARRKDFGRAVLMPGLINAHCHSGLLRGTPEGVSPADGWPPFINPMHRVLRSEDAEAASWLCYGESLLAGTTTLVDMWRFMDGSARAAEALGLRVVLVPSVGEAEGFDYFERLADNESLIHDWHGAANGRINVWVGVERPFWVTPEACQRAVALCRRYGVGLHAHVNETSLEIEEIREQYNLPPIPALELLGLLEADHVLLAHCAWLGAQEIALMQKHRVGVAYNPTSNMTLKSSTVPMETLIEHGIAVGIGSDGVQENNFDMLGAMKVASLLARFRAMPSDKLPSWRVLRMATIEGARALGMADRIGSLEPGKQADIIAVRGNGPHMTPFIADGPFRNLHNNIVHAAQSEDVIFTMVDGCIVAENGALSHGDMAHYIADAERAAAEVITRRMEWLQQNATGTDAAEVRLHIDDDQRGIAGRD